MQRNPGRLAASAVVAGAIIASAQPIRLHPENPRWFEWRGRALALITSAEHYGAVLNLDFDIRRYLETLEREGLNYTRVFSGAYVEPTNAFNIQRNTLAPAPGRFLAPWVRSDEPGAGDGGTRFDLDRFSDAHLRRLRDFIAEADRRGIVVELTLFCATYGPAQWAIHPFNPSNNIQRLPVHDYRRLHLLPVSADLATARASNPAFRYQEALVRHLVRGLNEFDNLFYEIQNEPWADNSRPGEVIHPWWTERRGWPNAVQIPTAESVAWQRAIAAVIRDEERRLPKRHLIAQNIANFVLAVHPDDLVPEAELLNFHYALPEAVGWNRGWKGAIGCDETGFMGREDTPYRRQAWRFVMSGGALFNHLDYSFTVGHEDGSDIGNEAPGGGGPTIRRQLAILSRFLHQFDLTRLEPDCLVVEAAPGVATWSLSVPGLQYAIYVEGRGPTELWLRLPPGRWRTRWISVEDGKPLGESVDTTDGTTPTCVPVPDIRGGAAARIVRS
ncbi:MAG: hypothetical protein N2652_02190 [Kiritimatiellae bacterium]|nr:hypothetical protein [Kiritimatiellia bacterium]